MTVSIDTDPRYGRFSLRTECPRCGAHLPVDGPVDRVDCADCGHDLEVPLEVLRHLFETFEDEWPKAERGTITTGDLTWRWTSDALARPTCPDCEGPLGEPEDGLSTCGSCGVHTTATAPPKRLRKIRGLRLVLGGASTDERAEPASAAPVALACPACGAGLTITSAHDRLTPCDHCGSQVHLPDGVWRALHPARIVRPWLARFDGPSRPAQRAQRDREAQAREAEKHRKVREHELQQAQRRAAEHEAREREAQAKREREAAEKAARDERQRRRDRWTLIPTAICFLLSLGCVALLAVGAAGFGLGHVLGLRPLGVSAAQARLWTGWLAVGAIAPVLPVWLLCVAVAAWRGGRGFLGVLVWSGFMSLLTLIPFAGPILGLVWAVQHFQGREPTPDNETLPRFTGWPLGLLYLTVPAYLHLWFAIAGDVLATTRF